MDNWLAALGIVLAYLLGSIPSAYLLLKLTKGQDIRTLGTGNVGALNMYQQMGLAAGVAVMLADVGKGVLAVHLPSLMGAPDGARYFSAIAVVAGHTWPIFLRLNGGKGAATILGVGLGLAPVLAGIALVPVIVAVVAIRNVVVGVALAFILFNILTIATGEPWALIGACLALTVGVVANYLARTIQQVASALRSRRWRSLLYPE